MDEKIRNRIITGVLTIIFLALAIFIGKLSPDTDEAQNPTEIQYPAETEHSSGVQHSDEVQYPAEAQNPDEGSGSDADEVSNVSIDHQFRNKDRLSEHFKKHGEEVNAASAEDYLTKANAVISNTSALTKYEKEDGDKIFFIESTGEIVFLSGDGYIRTYFVADKDYFDRQ